MADAASIDADEAGRRKDAGEDTTNTYDFIFQKWRRPSLPGSLRLLTRTSCPLSAAGFTGLSFCQNISPSTNRLLAATALMPGSCHAPFLTIRPFLVIRRLFQGIRQILLGDPSPIEIVRILIGQAMA